MHAATVSFPALIAVCTTGAAKSTSQVVMMMSAPCARSFVAQALAIAALLPCVLQVISLSFVVFDFSLLTALTCVCAVASAGPSNGAMFPMPS